MSAVGSSENRAALFVPLPTEEVTIELAARFARLLAAGDLLILTGTLGAGKTFFARALCHALGLDEDEPVTSPTFTLVHEYETTPPVHHADLYRLRDEDEVFELGLDSRRREGALLLVEWGAPFVRALGGNALELELSVEPRSARLAASSARALELLDAWRSTFGSADFEAGAFEEPA